MAKNIMIMIQGLKESMLLIIELDAKHLIRITMEVVIMFLLSSYQPCECIFCSLVVKGHLQILAKIVGNLVTQCFTNLGTNVNILT